MDLSIIIINWNSMDYLEKCLASVFANRGGLEFEVVVVDNASFDGCGEMLARLFPQVKFVQSQDNLGFARANNLGVAHASGRALLFLNPDTEVKGNALATLFSALESAPEAGVIGARLLNTDGTVQTSCIQSFPTILNQAMDTDFLRNRFPRLRMWGTWPLLEKQRTRVEVDVISGACMMVQRSHFERVGQFSTDYFMYSEDVDLCFKSHKAGLRNYYVDDAEVVHHGGGSSSFSGSSAFVVVTMKDARLRYFTKHRGALYASAYRATMVLVAVCRCAMLGLLLPSSHGKNRAGVVLRKWLAVLKWGLGVMPARHT